MSRYPIFVFAIFSLLCLRGAPIRAANYFVYFGTQSEASGAGISMAHFDSDTGVLTPPQFILAADGPSFFAHDVGIGYLYSTNYTGAGGVSSYKIDRETGALTLLNRISGGNFGTSHISRDPSGRFVMAANFDHGHVAVFPIQPDGSLGPPTAMELHTGSSVNPVRQKTTYPHCIITDPANHFALVPDLGLDKLFVYRFDDTTGKLTANNPPFAPIKPGSGPRHVCFYSNKWVYLLNEMGGTIDAFLWGPYTGHLTPIQSISTLPADFHGENTSAEIAVAGNFLYASNRGDDSIAVFAIDPVSGKLKQIQRVPTLGKNPRDFILDASGKWLICTNQASNNVVVFSVDPATGMLTPTGQPQAVPAPCGLAMIMAPATPMVMPPER